MHDTVVMYLELCLVLCLTPHCMYSSMKSFTHTRERERERQREREREREGERRYEKREREN